MANEKQFAPDPAAYSELSGIMQASRPFLTVSPLIEAITPTHDEWARCETVQDTYDLMKRRLTGALTPMDELQRLGQEYDGAVQEGLREAAQALVAKLDECDQHIADAFFHREMRCGPYEGPNYSVELRNLRRAISATPAQEGEQ